MQLAQMTWQEVEVQMRISPSVILPTGSIEQHGPMGLLATDAICAEEIARSAAEIAKTMVAPTLAYAPAPFNMAFPGTMSLSVKTYVALVSELLVGLEAQGFSYIYVLNAHGANLEPLRQAAEVLTKSNIRITSWWDFEPVNKLRYAWYGEWEGMHATPSEISITQATTRSVPTGDARQPPEKLTPDYITAHAGDRHGSPQDHRRDFPDGRVGSHSALADPEQGRALLELAAKSVASDFLDFTSSMHS